VFRTFGAFRTFRETRRAMRREKCHQVLAGNLEETHNLLIGRVFISAPTKVRVRDPELLCKEIYWRPSLAQPLRLTDPPRAL